MSNIVALEYYRRSGGKSNNHYKFRKVIPLCVVIYIEQWKLLKALRAAKAREIQNEKAQTTGNSPA